MKKKSVFFGLSKGKRLAQEVAENLGVKIGEVVRIEFKDTELLTFSQDSVRGKHVFVCQSTSRPVNDSLMELLIFIDSLKRASAKSITVIMPYFGYARQDRKAAGRHPITASLVAKLIQDSGASRIVTLDIHSEQIQGFFSIPVDHLFGGAVLIRAINGYLTKENCKDNLVVVSPDYGGVVRARSFANILNAKIAIIDKNRTEPNKSTSLNVLGNVKGKIALIVDDMIDTGGTIVKGVELLMKEGARQVIVAATHPVFSDHCLEKLSNSLISKIFVANTIDIPYYQDFPKLEVVTIAPYIADVVRSIDEGHSITKVYENYTKI